MMLLTVPAVILPTVTTAGSNTSMRRVIIVCSDCTISHAIGIGSSARYGSLAWPPRPLTVMNSVSAAAMIDPPRRAQPPGRQRRRDVQGERAGDRRLGSVGALRQVEQAFLEHEPGAVDRPPRRAGT